MGNMFILALGKDISEVIGEAFNVIWGTLCIVIYGLI